MASDLPDPRYYRARDMAAVLVTYMDDAAAIQLRIREDFDNPPALCTIRKMRAEFLAGRAKTPVVEQFKAHEGYYPCEVANDAASINRAFLAILRAEHPERFAA